MARPAYGFSKPPLPKPPPRPPPDPHPPRRAALRALVAVAAACALLLLFGVAPAVSTAIAARRPPSPSPEITDSRITDSSPRDSSPTDSGITDAATAEAVEAALARRGSPRTGHCAAAAGAWCAAFAAAPPIPPGAETPPIASRACPGAGPHGCGGGGVCDAISGKCNCAAWWTGEGCDVKVTRRCNWRRDTLGRPEDSAGPASKCPGVCDNRLALCYCPRSSAYGGNATAVAVGTALKGPVPALHLFGNPAKVTGQTLGWCEAAPGQRPAKVCECPNDGLGGELCGESYAHTCLNSCSGRGGCEHGFCWCQPGFFGADCSQARHPVSLDQGQSQGQEATGAAGPPLLPPPSRPRTRPLIYVYDSLPPKFNGGIFSYRYSGRACAHRRFGRGGQPVWVSGAPGYIDWHLHEALLASPHRTLDPDAADFFYVPIYLTCLIWPVLNFAEHPQPNRISESRLHSAIELAAEARSHLEFLLPFWNRTRGADHIFYFGHDEGGCWAPESIASTAIILSHWGRMDTFSGDGLPVSSSAYYFDNFDRTFATRALIGRHRCFEPGKDIVIPAYTRHPEAAAWRAARAAAVAAGDTSIPPPRTTLLVFLGTMDRECAEPARCYSRGIRQTVKRLFSSSPGFVLGPATKRYSAQLLNSVFALVAPGDGFSTRLEDALLHGCIPVIVQDNVLSPWGTLLDFSAFSVRIAQADLPGLESVIRGIPPERIAALAATAAAVAPRFDWAGGFHLLPRTDDRFSAGGGRTDDALGTLMAALLAKRRARGGARGRGR